MKVDMYKVSRAILYIGLVIWAVGITMAVYYLGLVQDVIMKTQDVILEILDTVTSILSAGVLL